MKCRHFGCGEGNKIDTFSPNMNMICSLDFPLVTVRGGIRIQVIKQRLYFGFPRVAGLQLWIEFR